MPQREFWTERIPTEVVWRYWTDPTTPEKGGKVTVTVNDQEGAPIVTTGHSIPLNVTWEAVDGFLRQTWESYLFRPVRFVQNASAANANQWNVEAKKRANPKSL